MKSTITADAASLESPSETSNNWQVLNGIGVAIFIGLIWSMSLPGITRTSVLLALGGFVAASVWTLYLIRLHRKPARMIDVAIVPLLIVVLLVLTMWSLPLKARFATSKATFEAVAETITSQPGYDSSGDVTSVRLPQTLQPEGRTGSYDIKLVQWNSADIFFYTELSHGFVYLPNGTDHLGQDIHLTPVSGDWYKFSTSF